MNSQSGSSTSSISTTQELRNASAWAPPQTHCLGKTHCFFSLLSHSQHFGQQVCECFSTPTKSQTLTGCPTRQFNSDTNWSWHRSLRLRIQSHKMSPTLDANQKQWVLRLPLFCPTWLQIQGSHNPLFRFTDLLEQLTEPRKKNSLTTIADSLQRTV